LVRRVIKESMHQTEPIDQVDTVDVKVESVDEKPDQESVEPELVATVDARAILQRDLEEAQKALVVLDTIRQVYGEASELEDAVVQAYRRRRQVA
jgi:predicted transcriptional regulator